jgi:Predicted transcriptional regulators
MKKMLAQRLGEVRKRKGISQQNVADSLGLSRGRLGNYEQGTREPDSEMLRQLANFYNVSVDYLLGNSNEPRPPIGGHDIRLAAHNERRFDDVSNEEADMLEAVLKAYRADPKNRK